LTYTSLYIYKTDQSNPFHQRGSHGGRS